MNEKEKIISILNKHDIEPEWFILSDVKKTQCNDLIVLAVYRYADKLNPRSFNETRLIKDLENAFKDEFVLSVAKNYQHLFVHFCT